mmetsp:Transcript_39358/g.76844  ORF Transcript_39358/g.76844 Transcript_39358/m.76844 type:complete len:111 (+) Transcript_39358:103-435(+)
MVEKISLHSMAKKCFENCKMVAHFYNLSTYHLAPQTFGLFWHHVTKFLLRILAAWCTHCHHTAGADWSEVAAARDTYSCQHLTTAGVHHFDVYHDDRSDLTLLRTAAPTA